MNEEEGSDYINANYIPVSTEAWSVWTSVSCTPVRTWPLKIAQYLLEAQSCSQHLRQLPNILPTGNSHQEKEGKKKTRVEGEDFWQNFATVALGEL